MEFVGAAAALTQLAKYGFGLANSIPETRRRLRQAPALLREWNHRASLLASLAETLQNHPALVPRVNPEIIARLVADVGNVASLLRDLAVATGDGKLARIKKRVHIIRKEKEVDKVLSSIGHVENALQAQILLLLAEQHHMHHLVPTDKTPRSARPDSMAPTTMTRPSISIAIGLPPRSPHFIGRKIVLQRMIDKMTNEHGRTVVLTGLGGTGKTAVAVELLHCIVAEDQQKSVFWIDGTTGPTLIANCSSICHNGKTVTYPNTVLEALTALRTHLHELNTSCVVVLDNMDVTTVLPETLKTVLGGSAMVRTVMTTRNLRFALRMVHPKDIEEISSLTLSEASRLLLSYTLPVLDCIEKATGLAGALKCHPSALIDAGIHIRLGSTLWLPYSRNPSSSGFDFDQYTKPPLRNYSHSVCRSTISMEALTFQNAASIPLLLCLACFHDTADTTELFSELMTTRENQDALALLGTYHLLDSGPLNSARRLNQFVRQDATAILAQYHDREAVINVAITAVTATTLPLCEVVSDSDLHQASVLRTAFEVTSVDQLNGSSVLRWITIALSLCERLIISGDFSAAIQFIARTITWATTSTSHTPDSLRDLRNKAGAVYYHQGLFEIAARTIQEAMKGKLLEIGSCHLNTVHSLNNLGLAHQGQGQFADAEKYHRKALDIKQHLFGRRHPEIFLTMNNLALSLQSQNKHDSAGGLFEAALRGRRILLGAHSLDVQISMSNLGVSYLIQKRYPEALDLFQRALKRLSRLFNQSHPEVLKCKGNIALTRERQGFPSEAVVWLLEVASVQKSALAEAHPDTLKTLRNVAVILHRQCEYEKAESVLRESLAMENTKYGRGDSRTFITLQHLSTILHEQKKFEEALDIAMWLYESRREKLGDNHPRTESSFDHIKELEGEIMFARLNSDIFTHCK